MIAARAVVLLLTGGFCGISAGGPEVRSAKLNMTSGGGGGEGGGRVT